MLYALPGARTIVIPLISIAKSRERNPSYNINNTKHEINKTDLWKNKLQSNIPFEIWDKFINTE